MPISQRSIPDVQGTGHTRNMRTVWAAFVCLIAVVSHFHEP